jgi:uncharacterized protein
MKPRAHDPRRLDVARFAVEGGQLAGTWPGGELARLADSQALPQDQTAADVAWRCDGERRPVAGGEPEIWLHLVAHTEVWLTCQRCLQPLRDALTVDRWLRFVPGEAEAEALDAESEHDVLALSRSLDLRELVEDELLLALPLVPRHASCSPLHAAAAAPARRPFEVLQPLKSGPSDKPD